ncbi:MAG: 2-C-methyl-D-erythritol 4-phosphate cytidylyltransferase [Microbacteriaceae bacterium]
MPVPNYAIVLAGGSGTRMKLNTPKQYLKLAGQAIIDHTLDTLDRSGLFESIILVADAANLDDVRVEVARKSRVTPVTVVAGGATRNESSYNGLAAITNSDANVLIHDAVRPFVDSPTLQRIIDALETELAVDTAIPTADTIIRVTDEMYIDEIPRRDVLYRGQTPQGFKAGVIRAAYEKAIESGATNYTDDCSVFLNFHRGGKVKVVLGESTNMKITDQTDLAIADKIFQLRKTGSPTATDDEIRTELTGKTVVVIGSSSGIGLEIVNLARGFGATVFGFSRSENNIHVEDPASVRDALAGAAAESGRIDIVINTAGILNVAPISELTDDDVTELLNVNLVGHINVVRAALPYVREAKGAIIGFASSSYTRGRANYALYSSSKAALVNMTQAIADEEPDVRINIVNPERTKTPMRVNAFGDEAGVPMLTAEEVAIATIRSLLTSETGSVFDVKLTADTASLGIKS